MDLDGEPGARQHPALRSDAPLRQRYRRPRPRRARAASARSIVGRALAGPAPIRDPLEPNDDVEFVRPGRLFATGLRAARRRGRRTRSSLAARLDAIEDPRDVYRIWLPARRAAPRDGPRGRRRQRRRSGAVPPTTVDPQPGRDRLGVAATGGDRDAALPKRGARPLGLRRGRRRAGRPERVPAVAPGRGRRERRRPDAHRLTASPAPPRLGSAHDDRGVLHRQRRARRRACARGRERCATGSRSTQRSAIAAASASSRW